ncbi:hypothetical protein DBR06_SOUSAS9410028 [Sousa chinensis]|uniref:Uncharacterized protein n=1 Tax=Sousa chinensis TaxID=103600 RepID=A0A484GYH4_SOUCH|nr:hypothetical protein DBR06_SOUSAS9410028 [Sousa chinensis]
MATARGPAYLLTLGRWRRGLGIATQSRALAALVPGVSQVDNKSDFLGKRSHRRHPGILQLSHVRLPQVLVDAAQLLLLESSMPNMEKQVQALTNYLWSRHLPVEPEDLQRRAVHLEKKFLENADSCQMEKLCGEVLHALRRTTYHWQELSYSEGLSLVYMAARLDGGFAAVSRAFHEVKFAQFPTIQARLPEFQPQTLMDFGSGTGSVTWAAHSTWGQSLREYMCVDSSAAMLELAEKLLKGEDKVVQDLGCLMCQVSFSDSFYLYHPRQVAMFKVCHVPCPVHQVQFDVVVSAFSLSELPSKANRTDVVQTLWRKTGHFLILVENGTKAGHSLLMDARDLVLNGKEKSPLDPRPGFVFAPCPHELPCPQLTASKPLACSFSQAYHPIPFSWNSTNSEGNSDDADSAYMEYPYGELIISLGFFFVFLLESLALQCCPGAAGRSKVQEQEWGMANVLEPHSHGPLPSPSRGPLRALVLLLSLSFHSVFEGLAVGLQPTVAATVQLCLAILAHKGLVVFGVGLRLVQVGTGSRWAMLSILSLALMSPLGLALGLAVPQGVSEGGQGLAQAVLEGMAAGTFLYVTFLEILPRELAGPEAPLAKWGCVAAGFAFMAFIALWA